MSLECQFFGYAALEELVQVAMMVRDDAKHFCLTYIQKVIDGTWHIFIMHVGKFKVYPFHLLLHILFFLRWRILSFFRQNVNHLQS